MGFHGHEHQLGAWLTGQQKHYDIYAPMRYAGGNTFLDVDCFRSGKVGAIEEFKRWALKDVQLSEKTEVLSPMCCGGIRY